LIIASKILQCIANRTEFEPTNKHCADVDTFVFSRADEVLAFVTALLNVNDIKKFRSVLDASVDIKLNETLKRQAEENLRICIKSSSPNQKELKFDIQTSVNILKMFYRDETWKPCGSKKYLHAFQTKNESTGIYVHKITAPIAVDMATLFTSIRNMEMDRAWDNATISIVEKYDEDHIIVHKKTKIMFPFTNRDFLFSRHFFESETECIMLSVSITRKDTPPRKGCVRGHVYESGVILEKLETKSTQFTYIAQVDTKGNLPSWVIALSTEMMINFLFKYCERFNHKT